ncbi:MAG: hypothetical protein JXA69_02165 [Phycisphaerae bacterium]|nr:hypothetical protein [Phycisphaerae bacterium]
MADWQIERTSGKCAASGRELAEGEEFYAVLIDRGETLERLDYALDAWTGPPEGAFCFWRTRVPVKTARKQLWVDNDVLINLFVRLADETEDIKVQFRFVLALLLMRKKILKYEQTLHDDGREYWQMRLVREQSVHRVENPHLTDAQTEAVTAQLSAILHGDVADSLAAHLAEANEDTETDNADGPDDAPE